MSVSGSGESRRAYRIFSSFMAQTRAATQPINVHPRKRFRAKIAPELALFLLKAIAKGRK
jgi:hypothetical protein